MSLQVIVTDLDQTLLHTNKSLSDYSARVLSVCRGRGLRLVYATARPIRTVERYGRQLQSDAAIYHNGAVLHADGVELATIGIAPEEAKRFLTRLEREEATAELSCEMGDKLFANFDAARLWPFTAFKRVRFSELDFREADKLLVGMNTLKRYDAQALRVLLPPDCYLQINSEGLGQIMRREATKLNALKRLSAHWGIPLSDMLAFGDDTNDVELLAECGVGVAVANAIPEARAAADEFCADNDADGVARWIEERLL